MDVEVRRWRGEYEWEVRADAFIAAKVQGCHGGRSRNLRWIW